MCPTFCSVVEWLGFFCYIVAHRSTSICSSSITFTMWWSLCGIDADRQYNKSNLRVDEMWSFSQIRLPCSRISSHSNSLYDLSSLFFAGCFFSPFISSSLYHWKLQTDWTQKQLKITVKNTWNLFTKTMKPSTYF